MTTTMTVSTKATGYTFGHVARMEWIKLRSLRSAGWTLLAGMAATVALGVVAGVNTRNPAGDPTSNVLSGILVGQLVVGVLGALAMTSEFSSGASVVTFGAVPRRGLVLGAKAAVWGTVFLGAGEVAVLLAFFLGTAALRVGVPRPALSDPAALRAVLMTGAYLPLVGLCGLGTGAIVRHAGAAVGCLAGGLFVVPLVLATAGRGIGFGRLLPLYIAGNSLAAVQPVAGFTWSPWLELGIVAAYPAVLLVLAARLLARRDI